MHSRAFETAKQCAAEVVAALLVARRGQPSQRVPVDSLMVGREP